MRKRVFSFCVHIYLSRSMAFSVAFFPFFRVKARMKELSKSVVERIQLWKRKKRSERGPKSAFARTLAIPVSRLSSLMRRGALQRLQKQRIVRTTLSRSTTVSTRSTRKRVPRVQELVHKVRKRTCSKIGFSTVARLSRAKRQELGNGLLQRKAALRAALEEIDDSLWNFPSSGRLNSSQNLH